MKEELPIEKKDSTPPKKNLVIFPKLPWIENNSALELTEEIEGFSEFVKNLPRLNEYNAKTILYYSSEEKIQDNGKLIEDGMKFFCKLHELSKHSDKVNSSEDMLITLGKIFIVLFFGGKILSSLKETSPRECARLIPPIHFLFLSDSKNLLMKQFGSLILQLCQQSFSYLQENIDESIFAAHSTALSTYFSDLFFFLALNSVYNDSQKFMKEAASDTINLVSSVYEQFLKLSICGGWIEDCLTSPIQLDYVTTLHPDKPYTVSYTSMARSLIKLTQIASETSFLLTPRLFCVYYSYYTCKIETQRKIFLNEDSLIKTLSQILKNHYTIYKGLIQGTSKLSSKTKASIEVFLNESLLCLKFIFFIFTSHEDPLHSLSKLELKLFLKEFVYLFIAVAYSNKLVALPKIENVSKNGDYASEILRIIAKFQINTRGETLRGKKKLFLPLALFLNELVLNCIDSLSSKKDRNPLTDQALRFCFSEYVQQVSGLKDSHFVELIVRMIEHPYFRYTAPERLSSEEIKMESTLDLATESRLLSLLNTVLLINKEWVAYFYRHIFPNIYNNISSDNEVFAILKLIVCSIFQVVLNNIQFIQALRSDSFDLTIVNEKAVQAFVDQKHIISLINILLQSYLLLSGKNLSSSLPKNCPVYATTDSLMISILEGCVGACLCIQSIVNEVVKNSEYFLYFVEISKDYYACRPFVFNFLSKALRYMNLYKVSYEVIENQYLPYILLKNLNEFTNKIFIQWNFLEAEISILQYHQKQLNINKAFTLYNTYIRHSIKSTNNPSLLLDLLELVRRLLYKNQETELENIIVVGLDTVLLERVSFLKQSDEMLRDIINVLLKIIFDSTTDSCISHELIMSILLMFLNKLIKEGKKGIALNCLENRLLDSAIWNSGINCLNISKNPTLKNLIKLSKKCRQYGSVFEKCLSAISSVISLHCDSLSLGNFCRLMCKYEDLHIIKQIVLSVSKLIEIESPREIFVLPGDQSSGIGLLTIKELPKKGFGFFCWIRIERGRSLGDDSSEMCLFSLNSDNQYGVTLELRECSLYYSISNPKTSAGRNSIPLSLSKLEYDKWYFIELYHLNEDVPKNLLLYINGNIQKDCQYPYYNPKANYTYNFIGCSINTAIIDKEKLEKTFRGQMSAVYFIEIQKNTLEHLHQTIDTIRTHGNIHEISSWLQLKEGEYKTREIAHHVSYKNIQELKTIFICANPIIYQIKCARNQVEQLCNSTQVRHLTPACNVILDRGGIKLFFPLLNHLAKLHYESPSISDPILNEILLSIFQAVHKLLKINRIRSKLFFEKEENILAFQCLLEEVVKRVDLLDVSVYKEILNINKTLQTQGEPYLKSFFEHVLGNVKIWMNVKNAKEIAIEMCSLFLRNTEKNLNNEFVLQVLLKAIEDLVCSENDEHPALQNFLEVTKTIVVNNPSVFIRLFECIFFDYFRIKPQYFTFIKFIMEIILHFFNIQKNFFLESLINTLKEFKEDIFVSTLFHLLDIPNLNGLFTVTPLRIWELDQIVAIVLYILMNIDWEKAKKWIPTDLSSGKGKKFINKNCFVSFLGKIVNLSPEERKIKIFLYGIQSLQKGQFLGIRTSLVVLCSALNIPYNSEEDSSEYLDVNRNTPKSTSISNPMLLIALFKNFQVINEQAQIKILENLYDIVIVTKEKIAQNFFGESSLGYIIETALCSINSDSEKIISFNSLIISTAISKFVSHPHFESLWKYISILMGIKQPDNAIKILYKVLQEIVKTKALHKKESIVIVLFYISYIIEDLYKLHSFDEKNIYQIFAMLLLVLHKTRLIYCTLPFERVTETKISPDYFQECEFRQGGFVRVILKLLFLSIKRSNHIEPINLLYFFIFRDKESLASIKTMSEYTKSEDKPITKPIPYSLINLSLQTSAIHCSMLETIKQTMRKPSQITSPKSRCKKDSPRSLTGDPNIGNSFFEQPGFLHIYLASEIIHLLHFEGFNMSNYQNIIEKRMEHHNTFGKKFMDKISEKSERLIELLRKILYFLRV